MKTFVAMVWAGILTAGLLGASHASAGGKLSTLEITESAVGCEDCVELKILGICYWLRCSWTSGCDILESMRVGHYVPDFVVSSYSTLSEWGEMQGINDVETAVITQTESMRDQATPLDFKHVDIFSHPALPAFNSMGKSDLFCESMIKRPLIPYFLSANDPAWNDPTVERLFPQSMTGMPKFQTGIGGALMPGYWAPLYPRCGWGAHPLDAINAAVAAHRASEIITRTRQPHVYVPVTGSCENKCWKPKPVTVNERHDNRFQMLAPDRTSSTRVFSGPVTWANGKTSAKDSYTWTLWRYYKCCKKRGDKHIGTTDF